MQVGRSFGQSLGPFAEQPSYPAIPDSGARSNRALSDVSGAASGPPGDPCPGSGGEDGSNSISCQGWHRWPSPARRSRRPKLLRSQVVSERIQNGEIDTADRLQGFPQNQRNGPRSSSGAEDVKATANVQSLEGGSGRREGQGYDSRLPASASECSEAGGGVGRAENSFAASAPQSAFP